MAQRPSVSEILARARSTPSGASSTPPTPAPQPAEPDRPLSASEKVAAIRAKAAQKKAESAPAPQTPEKQPAPPAAKKTAQPPSPPDPLQTPSSTTKKIAWPLAGLLLLLAASLWITRSASTHQPSSVVFSAANSLPSGSVDTSKASESGVFLIHAPLPDGSDGLYALSARCTFLGCSLTWDPSAARFVCPCHGCTYDLQGRPTAGPAPASLPRLAIYRSADGRVHIDRLHQLQSHSSEPPAALPLE